MYDDIDLNCGYRRDKVSERYQSVIPKGASVQRYATLAEVEHGALDITSLPQTHLIDLPVLPRPTRFAIPKKSVKELVDNVSHSIGAIAFKNGIPFASCILLSPSLILTTAHAIEGLPMQSLELILDYELKIWGLDLGRRFAIWHLIEVNAELDYAILTLNISLANFRSPIFKLHDQQFGICLLISHPQGDPKKVAIHHTLESDYQMLGYVGFHDSYPGSSGGAYINTEGKIVALHRLYGGVGFAGFKTGGIWIKKIYDSSFIMQQLYSSDGRYFGNNIYPNPDPRTMIPISISTLRLRKFLERVAAPRDFPPHDTRDGLQKTYHHIVPIGSLEFLWLLGRENLTIRELLKKLAWQGGEKREQTINTVAWATWNLIQGPAGSLRADDPQHDPTDEEKICPRFFNKELWQQLLILLANLRSVYTLRQALDAELKENRDLLRSIENYDGVAFNPSSGLMSSAFILRKSRILNAMPEYRYYVAAHNRIVLTLSRIHGTLRRTDQYNLIHFYRETEWREAVEFSTAEKVLYHVAAEPDTTLEFHEPQWQIGMPIPANVILKYQRGHLRADEIFKINALTFTIKARVFQPDITWVKVKNDNSRLVKYISLQRVRLRATATAGRNIFG